MCEHPGVSSTAALREARRRKILENSANRLKLIENLNSSVEKTCSEKLPEPSVAKPEFETSARPLLNVENTSPKTNVNLNEILKENNELKEISDFILRGSNNLDEDGEEEAKGVKFERKRQPTLLEAFFEKKLHYILLALMVNVLLVFNAGHFFYDNIFCPFYTVKLVEVISRRHLEQLQPVFLLFIAGLPKKAQRVTKVTLLLLSILLSDLCLYLFTFIVGNKIATSLG